jgi:hypothetical protein
MIPRERVLAAMNMEQPDRVPVICQFSIGFMNQQLKETDITPMELWYDADRYAEALLWLRERFGFDGILVSIHGHFPDWRRRWLNWKVTGVWRQPLLKTGQNALWMTTCWWGPSCVLNLLRYCRFFQANTLDQIWEVSE